MGVSFPDAIWAHIPHWISVMLIIAVVGTYVLSRFEGSRYLPVIGKAVSALFDVRSRRDNEVDADLADLRRQVEFLEFQLQELRVRDEMYWAWILQDQEWHRRYEFTAAERGWATIPHISFMEFRDRWMAQRFGPDYRTEDGPFF